MASNEDKIGQDERGSQSGRNTRMEEKEGGVKWERLFESFARRHKGIEKI